MARVKSWSYSSWSLYKRCPRAYRYSKIDKLPRKFSPAAERGITIHAKCEHFLLGNIRGVPKQVSNFGAELRNLKKHKAKAEKKYSLTSTWKETDWSAKNSWLRLVIDAEVLLSEKELLVVDFKTGRVYPGHEDQAMLYATALLQLNSNIERVHCEFWYLDQDQTRAWELQQGVAKEMRTYWEEQVSPMMTDTKFLPTPSQAACKWCDFKGECPDAYLY